MICYRNPKELDKEREISLKQKSETGQGEKSKAFSPGGIHQPGALSFWRHELKANDWVLEVLANGYVIPFEEPPTQYEEGNNKSAQSNIKFVQKTVLEMEKAGIIQFVKEKPFCISPLTVAEKIEPNGSKKLQLCWDGSRCVNKCLAKQKVTLSHLQRALEMTSKNDFQVKYDLKSAFHHIKIHKSHIKYLGAAFINEEGEKQYFVFLYLPFGLGSAVHCITKLMKPIIAYLHVKGIRNSIYIDDGRILASTKSEAEYARKLAYQVLEKAGWTLEDKKSDKEGQASQVKDYLGFLINTNTMRVQLIGDRKEAIKRNVEQTLANKARPIHVKELAKTLGKMVATEPALGTMALMAARAAYAQLDKVTEEKGWNSFLTMNEETTGGLTFFLENMSKFDNSVIRTSRNEISVISIIGPPDRFLKSSFVANHTRTHSEEIWASDSSGFATCAYSIKAKEALYYRGKLSDEEKKLSSGHRELLAVSQTLQNYSKTWEENQEAKNLYWLTDSENLVKFLTKGSGKLHIQREIFKVMMICQKLQIHIIPIHLRREDPRIQLADEGSKIIDTDNWQVDLATFKKFDIAMHFTIDLFASSKNSQCQRFFSNFWCKETLGIDAFCHSWDGETAWICPPVKLTLKVVRKIKTSVVKGVLLVPEWQTSDYWPEMFSRDGSLKRPFTKAEICRPFLMQEIFDFRSPFSGHAKFNFLALFFNNKL